MRRIAIIGGGISGLSAAHRLQELDESAQLTLYEASSTLGGVLRTSSEKGFLVEHGADMFTTRQPWALDLCRRLGFEEHLIQTNSQSRRAFIVHRGDLVPVPDGFTLMTPTRVWPIVRSPLLSLGGKMRMACEYLVPQRRDPSDESLAEFAKRRLGRQAYERLVQPLIGGIYTADPEKLSMRAALAEFVEMERTHGGLIRAMKKVAGNTKRESGARYGSFLAPREGMGSLVRALSERLPTKAARLNDPVKEIARGTDGGWSILSGGDPSRVSYDGLILATPSATAARLVSGIDADLSRELEQIPSASAAVVALGFRLDQIHHPLDGFGCVVPFVEKRRVLSVSFSSVKFEGRAPADSALLRVFVGGACQEELVELPDCELQRLVLEEVADLIGAQGTPELCHITRWRGAMPQYHLGHQERVERIERQVASLTNFALAGNAYRGVGIPFCVHSGENAAEALLTQLGAVGSSRP